MKTDIIEEKLNIMIPNPRCELDYVEGWQLAISVVLSAQCTDKRVNAVTKKIYEQYTLKDLAYMDLKKIEGLIKSVGSQSKKSVYLKTIAQRLYEDYEGIVPNNRQYLESLPGVGRKSANVILSELFNEPTFAVDTHVERVSKRLSLVRQEDNVHEIELKLSKLFKKENYNKINHQILLFGRYICTAKNPKCNECLIQCKYKKTEK